MDLRFEDFLAPVDRERLVEHMAKSWSWFAPIAPLSPIGITRFGDVFLSDHAGAIYFLDTCFGILEKVGATHEAFTARLPQFARAMLRVDLAYELEAYGTKLARGQCFGFGLSPLLGGPVSLANVAPLEAGLVLDWLGQLVRSTVPMAEGHPVRVSSLGRRRREPSYGSLTKHARDRSSFAVTEPTATTPRA
jgi:hypothetical protein